MSIRQSSKIATQILTFIFITTMLFLLLCGNAAQLQASVRESLLSREARLFPKETEILFTLSLGNFSSYSFPVDLIYRLKNFKAFDNSISEFQKNIELDMTKDFLSWIRGDIYMAVVKTGSTSPVLDLFKRSKEVGHLTLCKINMHEISGELGRYHKKEGNYPPSIETMKENFIEGLPVCPAGGTYSYEVSTDRNEYTLECRGERHKEDNATYRLIYSPSRGLEVKELENEGSHRAAANIICVIAVKDPEKARESLQRILSRFKTRSSTSFEESTYGGWTLYVPKSGIKGSFAITREYVCFSDLPELLKTTIDTANRKRPSLPSNGRFIKHMRNVSENSTITLFADVHEILGESTELVTKDSLGQELLRSCEFIGLWATLQKKSISGEAVLSLSHGRISDELEKMQVKQKDQKILNTLSIFPGSISNFTALDIIDVLGLFGRLSLTSKKNLHGITEDTLKKETGISWERDIKPAVTGRVGISYELGEIMADIIFSKLTTTRQLSNLNGCANNLSNFAMAIELYGEDHRNVLPPDLGELVPDYLQILPKCPAGGLYRYEQRGSQDYIIRCTGNMHAQAGVPDDLPSYTPSRGIEGNLPKIQEQKSRKIPSLPMLVGIELKDAGRAKALIDKLTGEKMSYIPHDYKDRKIYVAADESRAYVSIGNFLYFEMGGKVPRKLEKTIDALVDSRRSLASCRSFSRFEKNITGTVVLIRHDKVDWLFSMLKGVVLLAGSDFRDWAATIGEFQDSWGALSLDGQQVKVIFEIMAE
ncbi:MAG: DUF3352 domain-containing protein [Candidatus Xenobiia bacterium LiM19]